MRVLERVPGKYLLPLAAVFGTVVGLSSLPAHAAQQPGTVEVVTGSGGTGEACEFHVFARGFQEGQELRFTVHRHPSDGEVVLEGTFGIGANGHGRSPASGEHTLANGAYELRLLASPPGKTPPHPDEYGKGGDDHGAQAVSATEVGGAKFSADGDRSTMRFHEQFTRVFELTCDESGDEVPQAPEEPANPGTQEQPVETPVAHEPNAPAEPEETQEPAQPAQPARPEQEQKQERVPAQPQEPEASRPAELPRTGGVSVTKLLAGGLGLMFIGGFLVVTSVRRRES